ncbi:hypothetical protein [Isoptericola croceus]|uniref:hypothetical protein n=1 Tax=Isoptericola croceus TaxID=3031406 RepID=UPI0023F8E115|nr:hypothetical protein [Isoptericola croceus]
MTALVPRAAAVAVALTLALGLTACGDSDADTDGDVDTAPSPSATARPLTTDEAQGLATMRFQNYAAGVRTVRFEVADAGRTYAVDGWVDFVAHLGYAGVHETSSDETGLLAWSAQTVSTFDGDSGASEPEPEPPPLPPLPPPGMDDDGTTWTGSDLVPDQSRLHALLAVIVGLGNDRPDNPVLLQQSDARWLRQDSIDGVPVQVLAGPTSDDVSEQDPDADGSAATVRYWVDESWRILRLEMRPGGSGDWIAVDLGEAEGVDFADAFQAVGQAAPTP